MTLSFISTNNNSVLDATGGRKVDPGDLGIRDQLLLGVEIEGSRTESRGRGHAPFQCAMGMLRGKVVVTE